MPITTKMQGANCHIAIEGEMTIFVAQDLKLSLQEPLISASEIEVDLSQVTEIDAAGLQLMIVMKIEAMAHGSQLRFTNHSALVQEILELSNLASFFGDPLILEPEAA